MYERITHYKESVAKKGSKFSFTMEGIADHDEFGDMLRSGVEGVRIAIWGEKGHLCLPFESIALEPLLLQNTLHLTGRENGAFVARIEFIDWTSLAIKNMHDEEGHIGYSVTGQAIIDIDQLAAIQKSLREHQLLNARWSTAQQNLPLTTRANKGCNDKDNHMIGSSVTATTPQLKQALTILNGDKQAAAQ